MTTMLAMLKRQRGAAPLQPSDESADDSTSTSLRDPTYNICQEAFCDDGRKAAFFFPFLISIFVIIGFLCLVRTRRRARDTEKIACDKSYVDAHKRGVSFDYASIPSHDPTTLPPQYAALEKDYTVDTFSLPRGVSRASFGGRSFSINSRSNFSDLGTISSQRSYPHQMPPSMTRLQEYEQEEYGQRPQLLHTPNASPQPMDTTGRQSMFDLDQYYSGSDETPNTSEEDRVHLARGARATIYSSRSNSTSTSASESRQHLYTHHATPSSSSNHLNFNDLPTRSQSRR